MKSAKMAPGMNDKPVESKPAAAGDSKLADFIANLSQDECMELQELLEEKLGTDLDNDNEEGEPADHAEKVTDSDEMVGLTEE